MGFIVAIIALTLYYWFGKITYWVYTKIRPSMSDKVHFWFMYALACGSFYWFTNTGITSDIAGNAGLVLGFMLNYIKND